MKAPLKAVVLTVGVVGAVVLATMALVSPSTAATSGKRCKDLEAGSGWQQKVNVRRHRATVPVTAPEGFLIDMYCVKTGGGRTAARLVQVSPPAAQAVVDHPTKTRVRHYALHLVPASGGTDLPSGPPATEEVPPSGPPASEEVPPSGPPASDLVPPSGPPATG